MLAGSRLRNMKFKHYFFSKIFFNLLCWLFIGFGFLFIPVFAEGMGFVFPFESINGIGSFISEPFVWATLLGYVLMTAILLVLKKVMLRLRKRRPGGKERWPVLSDLEAEEMFFSEWLSQINSIANLAMAAFLLYAIDNYLQGKVFTAPVLAPRNLLAVSLAFYGIGAILFYAFGDPSASESEMRAEQPN